MTRVVALRSLVVLFSVLMGLAIQSGVAWANASVSVSAPDATQGVATSVTVSGSTDLTSGLYVFVDPSDSGCGSLPDAEDGTPLTNGTAIGPGSFSETFSYTPASANTTYEVCAYVDDTEYDTPDAQNNATFTTNPPAASVSISAPNTTQGVVTTVLVSGSTELARNLYVYVDPSDGGCGSLPDAEDGTPLTNGTAIGPGSFSETYSYTPASANTTYEVCAYVDDTEYDTPDAQNNASFIAGAPAASVSSSTASSIQNLPSSVLVSGSTELARNLYVYVDPSDGGCGSLPDAEDGTPLTNGTAIGPGSFSETYSYTPASANTTYEVCAYVDDTEYDTPDAVSADTFKAAIPPASVKILAPRSLEIGSSSAITIVGATVVPEKLSVQLCQLRGCIDVTRAGGVSLPAGSFTKSFEIAPYSFGASIIRATIIDPAGAYHSATTTWPFIVPSASLTSPADNSSGPQLNPEFGWTGPPSARYALIIGQRSGRRIASLLQLQQDGYVGLPSPAVSHKTGLADSALHSLYGAAAFSVSGNRGVAKLDRPLPPGHYAWRVVTSAPAGESAFSASGWRSFTVLGPRLRHLSVRASAHPEPSFRTPGYSTIEINATEYSTVRIRVIHNHQTATRTLYLGDSNTAQLQFNWSCARAGGSISYKVTAHDQEGDHRSVSGASRIVSVRTCSSLHAALIAAIRARNIARERAAAAAQRRYELELEAEYERFVHNCRALGGTPVTLYVGDQSELVCRAPYGGTLNVPY